MAERWRRFCIVGPGNHALTKLVPALEANGQNLVGVVSRRPGFSLAGVPIFGEVPTAIAGVPEDTVFLLSSPPCAHFEQARVLLEAGRDVVLEKPAFVTRAEARDAAALASDSGSLLVEAFMHRHTAFHAEFLRRWRADRGRVGQIVVEFLLPGVPAGTFRDDCAASSSLLMDIGCYVLSLLHDIGMADADLALTEFARSGGPNSESYELTGRSGEIAILARLGVAGNYRNSVVLKLFGEEEVRFEPFFYGRPGTRTITTRGGPDTGCEELVCANGFEAMLSVAPEKWRRDQAERLQAMIERSAQLERLGQSLLDARRSIEAGGSGRACK